VPVYGYFDFPKPSVLGFPTAVDPAHRSCRYLVQPPTVPSLARLWGYQSPPRGGRGRCRRACERTPIRGRRRCAAGGRLVSLTQRTTLPVRFGRICEAVKHWRCYLEGSSKFLVVTDHDTLRHLLKQPNNRLNKRQARYLRDLQPFAGSMTLAYRKGDLTEADPLSRRPHFVPQATVP
jgi:hypothetical protein